jgi:hypothetical protein
MASMRDMLAEAVLVAERSASILSRRVSASLVRTPTSSVRYVAPRMQSAFFNFQSLLTVMLLMICLCTFVHTYAPSWLDAHKKGYAHDATRAHCHQERNERMDASASRSVHARECTRCRWSQLD